LLTLLVAGGLSAVAIGVSLRALGRSAEVLRSGVGAEDDELEQRLAVKEQALVLGLSSRNVRALGRAALFGGTGCAVWELTGGSAHYLPAAGSFCLGFVGWAGCSELERRIGSLAGARRASRKAR
jgi:hypothetical protein